MDDLEYEISYGTDITFVSSTTINSTTTPADWANVTTPADIGPFNSGDTVSYTIPGGSALTDDTTYWWKVRAKDPNGANSWSPWSDADSFTIDTTTLVSTWFQTTQEQFEQGTLSGLVASTSDSVEVSTQVGEYGKVIVTDEDWSEITTQVQYNNPVVVASLRYSPTGDVQRSVRVRNKTGSTFEIKADDPNGLLSGTTTVDYMVMEAGTWTIEDASGGTQVIAGTYSDVTDVQGGNSYAASGYGADVTFSPAFSTPPAVIATVSTENDSSWVVAHLNDGNTRNNPPTVSAMGLYLGRSGLSAVHDPEDIDYVAFEPGHGTNNGGEFDADFGADAHNQAPATAEAFNAPFGAAPEVILTMQGAEQGGNGAWMSIYAASTMTGSNYFPVSDESGDRNHTLEPTLTISFENSSGILLRDQSSGGDLSGTIYSEPILFSDGAGPKFEQLLWTDDEVGTSTAVYQLQYFTSTSSWAFIPDVDLPNNSTGTTTSPIDLTGLNVSTYDTLRILATLQCASSNCPELDDWTIEWSEGVTMSGTLKQYDRSTNVAAGTVTVSINGGIPVPTGSVAAGVWSIDNVTAFEGDILTVFVDGANEANEAVAVFQYDGLGDITNVNMFEGHLSLTSDELSTTTMAELALGDNSVIGDEDVFFDVSGGDLTVCAVGSCEAANLYIDTGNIFIPASSTSQSLTTHDFLNYGTVELDGTTFRVSGSWDNQGSVSTDISSLIFTATSSAETVDDLAGTLPFYNLTFGETSGTATWTTKDPMDIDGDLAVTYGTLARASSTITAAKAIATGVNGYWTGISTTTFDGSGAANWSDANPTSQDIGRVLVDGAVRTVNVASDVRADSIVIGANDTLNGGGSYDIQIAGDFTNNNVFVPSTSRVVVLGDSTLSAITIGGSNLYALRASTTNGSVSFTDVSVSLLDNFELATGTVTLPTALLQVGGSFLNTGGDFAHNNAEVRFNGSGVEIIEQQGTNFLNAFYDVSFTGSGAWSFNDTIATTTNDFEIQSGAVTLPSSELTVGGLFSVSGSGVFIHNSGEVILLIQDGNTVLTNGSDFNDIRIRSEGGAGAWYDNNWGYRKAVTISASAVDATLTDFPVYVDVSDFDSGFFAEVTASGGDIRVTQGDGMTELAREIVSIDTGAETGELYFNANSISSTTNTTFYLYYGNSGASDYATTDPYGAENTWSNSYEGVWHMNDVGTTITDSTSGGYTGTKGGGSAAPTEVDSPHGKAQSFDGGDYIDLGDVLDVGSNSWTIDVWYSPTAVGVSRAGILYNKENSYEASAGGNNSQYAWRPAWAWYGAGTFTTSINNWYFHSVTFDHITQRLYKDGSEVFSRAQTGNVGSNTERLQFGARGNTGHTSLFTGEMDEVRMSSAARSPSWLKSTHINFATTSDFYSISTSESAFVRTFSDVNTSVLGNFVIESGEVVFPTGVLSVGGSFDNDGTFNSNSGTVEFDSIAGAETIAVGSSTFATLAFDSSAGDFTIIENATATVAVELTDASSFTLNSGFVLESIGTFYTELANATTTWTGSTLRLSSGTDYAINSKTNSGDTYAILYLTDDTDISIWNSTAGTYATNDTASIYSQDHAATDGDLYVFGDYVRALGTEHWSYETDFDGADLVASSTERQVNVRVVSGGSVTASSSILSIAGSSTATTTIDSQSGTFTLLAQTATVTASYFEMTGTDADGFNLTSSSTVTLLDNALFTIGAGVSAITVDATTIDTSPGAQFFNTDFVTGGGSANVTLSGGPTSYWWFRDGAGDRYGEAFDNADGDPGSIRWDDSSYTINISGTVYSDDGATVMGGPTCDGLTTNVRIVVDGGVYTDSASCSGVDGSYSFAGVAYVGDPNIVVYLNTNGGENGTVVTKTPTADVTDLDIYADRVMTRHEDTAPLTIADMVSYDETDDTDIKFVAATGTPDTLIVRQDTELIVASSTIFSPGGNLTLESNGSGNAWDGSLHIDDGATFTAAGTEAHLIGGSFFNDINSSFTAASSTFEFTATTSGKGITNADAGTLDFNEVQFTGVGGGWNITADIKAESDVTVATGTVTGTGDITMTYGAITGNGLLSMGGGTTTILTSTTLGGSSAWTFYDLVLGDGATISTTTRSDNATTTISGQLVIEGAHYLDTGSSVWSLAGTGDVIVENGTILEDTSTFVYSGGTGSNVLSTNYYNLQFAAAAGTPTYTFPVLGVLVNNNFNVLGSVTTTADINSNDTVVAVLGDVNIGVNGVLLASNNTALTVSGSYDNDGTFTSNAGEIVFDSVDAYTIAAGSSSLADVTLNGAGAVTITENATSTGLFTIASASDFTQQAATVLAIGGQLDIQSATTDWLGSTLSLYGGGDYLVNPKTVVEEFENIVVGANTEIRLWNTTATTTTVDAAGSLYSQDHNNIAGDLYIFGLYQEETRADYWSYETDFDGVDLSGGSERQADIYLESSASATWTGGSLSVIGSSTASSTVQNQGSGTYSLTIGGTATTDWDYLSVRDIDSNGITFTGTPTVTGFNRADLLVEINSASAMTVGGTAINASPARTFTGVIINDDIAVTGAVNVTATGTSISGWRFTAHTGDVSGEAFDSDPAGDPGYVIWDDSAAIISISGNVYESDTSSVSSACDDSTTNIVLSIAGSIAQNASSSCSSADGSYSISGVSFGSLDELMIYIDGNAAKGVVVTKDPVSSISDMNIYENHVIVRHENTAAISIADMSIWDSSDDADIQYTAVTGSPDTITLPADTKLIVWTNKEFEPLGDVVLAGGGAGAAYDGTLELLVNAIWTGQGTEALSVGGSMTLGAGATFAASNGTTTFTTTGAARIIDTNEDAFNNVAFTGSGSWTMADTNANINGDAEISSGVLTLSTGTSTFGGSFINLGGSFNASNGLAFFVGSSETVTMGGSDLAEVEFAGGDYVFSDTNATTTESFTISSGDVTLPSGIMSVAGDFQNTGGTFTHNTSELVLTNAVSGTVLASSSDLYAVTFNGGGSYIFDDENLTLLDSLFILNGTTTLASGTLAIGGSFDSTGGTFIHSSGTVLFNSGDAGEFIDADTSHFYNVQISSPAGGYTLLSDATTTNNFVLASAGDFTAQTGSVLVVNGVFQNTVSGANTTWLGSTLKLDGVNAYTVNTKISGDDRYDTLIVGDDSDIRLWNSSATTTSVASSSSLYSQDHAAVDGDLYIYGDFAIATTSEYWSYASDFDGASLTGGSRRAVTVSLASYATTTVTTAGSLAILGEAGATTTIQNQGAGNYTFIVDDGSLNMEYYALRDMDINGLNLSGSPVITSLSYGDYELSVDTGSLITLEQLTLDSNPSFTILNTRFATSAPATTGTNVNLSATTTNSWTFRNEYGPLSGEDYDIDGDTNCDSIRWDDSSCLLTEQTEYRWRYDDGGIDVPDGEWLNASWAKRTRVRVANNDNVAYSNAVTLVTVAYDSDMQADFDDLRFTSSDGVTAIDFWVEKFTSSISADVWVEVPALAADDAESLFMYYGNVGAASISSSTAVMIVVDDFEDNNITEYSGDTSLLTTAAASAYGGSYGLELTSGNEGTRLTDGIARFGQTSTTSQGETIRYKQYVDTGSGSSDEACTMFGVQLPVTANQNYGVCLELFGTDRISLVKDVESTDTYGGVSVLASSTLTYSTGWYEVEIDWLTDNTIFVSLYDNTDTLVATTTATDSTYTSGGFGFTSWGQNGGWDSFTSRTYMETDPTIFLGAEQIGGGATYAAAQNTQSPNFQVGDVARLRLAIENTGLDITGQLFALEYAAKGVAPSCAAVDPGNYVAVPVDASCGVNAICMATSTSVANGVATTDLLDVNRNTFTAGEFVEDPSNQTSGIDVNQNFYTELEYAISVTANASDQSYCFRVTDNGSAYDSYVNVPEITLKFDPVMSAITFNEGNDITLLPGATTTVYATGTATDLNGYADLTYASSTMYRSGVAGGAACSADNNDCYISTTASTCSFTNCSGNSCTVECYADIYFHADPTDTGSTYDGQEWLAFVEVEDSAAGYDFASAIGIELMTLRAIEVSGAIDYGALAVNADTGAFNASTTIANFGNVESNLEITGTDLSDGVTSVIPAPQQIFATSSFTYSSCGATCDPLSSTTPISLDVDLAKPAVDTPPVEDEVYWGIAIPFGTNSAAHQGVNIFTAVSP
ncbi:MAG: DUF2341 domain-containing protein [Candidatus Pacebacteria bacterium]|nr:DUF2341 domain-containing protein [Candidatus Paceibacterota bacterium]